MKFWIRLRCFFHGHDDVLVESPSKLVLKCQSCGNESTGLLLDTPRPKVKGAKILRFKRRLAA